ncbi:MAG TPA: hypothetical protein VGL47_08270 [Amycolatopsis sp.]|uniref:Uncharacterized protein n=1 Tax=Amycolatopsis nalaikhensis TaxID=715472 RepID=A0ABY8XL38_9PSEU|nr:hypothetical protein [Amycolatopsis sp. 2-2]WIV56327.1 hypothetical protein QP939_47305 [Amycolatopsis sp. 2-2]
MRRNRPARLAGLSAVVGDLPAGVPAPGHPAAEPAQHERVRATLATALLRRHGRGA